MSCHVTSCHVMSCHVMSCHLTSSHVFSRLVTSCHVMSCHVISRLLTSCHVLSYHVILLENLAPESFFRAEPSKFFYYCGGVAPTRFSKPWPCAGIRLGATLSLRRRAHCERARVAPCAFLGPGHRFAWQAAGIGRVASVCVWRRAHFWDRIVLRGKLRGSGVLEVCRGRSGGRAGALCRGDWVPGALCTRMANVRFAWQAAGIVRAGSVLGACWRACRGAVPWGLGSGRVLHTHGQRAFRVAGCGNRACWDCAGSVLAGRVGGAVPWGLGSGRVARAHDFTRCDLRFAWEFGCIDALGKALDGGSAWQAQ